MDESFSFAEPFDRESSVKLKISANRNLPGRTLISMRVQFHRSVGRASRCGRAINRCHELFNVIVIINPPGVLFTLARSTLTGMILINYRARAGTRTCNADGCRRRLHTLKFLYPHAHIKAMECKQVEILAYVWRAVPILYSNTARCTVYIPRTLFLAVAKVLVFQQKNDVVSLPTLHCN